MMYGVWCMMDWAAFRNVKCRKLLTIQKQLFRLVIEVFLSTQNSSPHGRPRHDSQQFHCGSLLKCAIFVGEIKK